MGTNRRKKWSLETRKWILIINTLQNVSQNLRTKEMKKLILLVLTMSLTGCTITGRYYLRNLSDQPAIVTIVLNETLNKWDTLTTLKYDDNVKDIKFGTLSSLKKNVILRQIDMNRLEFTIPPRSTVFIGIGMNTDFRGGFQQAKIKVGDKEQTLTTNDREQMNIKMSGLMNFTGHYDIKL